MNTEFRKAIVPEEIRSLVIFDHKTFHKYPADWFGAMSNTVDVQMGSVTRQLAAAIVARADVLRRSSITAAVAVGAAVILVGTLAVASAAQPVESPSRTPT